MYGILKRNNIVSSFISHRKDFLYIQSNPDFCALKKKNPTVCDKGSWTYPNNQDYILAGSTTDSNDLITLRDPDFYCINLR